MVSKAGLAVKGPFGGLALAILAGGVAAAADDPGRWTPLETLKYRPVSDVQVSPDGRRAAYVVRESVMEPRPSEYRTQIWLAIDRRAASPGRPRSAESSATQPRWSPDGKGIAFLSKRGEKTVNVWLLPAAGGEASRLTDAPADVKEAAWSPDGRWLAYVAADGPDPDNERREKEKDDARVVGDDDRPGRLWLVRVAADAAGRREARKLLAAGFSVGSVQPGGPDAIDWSPDGKTIAVLAHGAARRRRLADRRISLSTSPPGRCGPSPRRAPPRLRRASRPTAARSRTS